MNTLFDNLMAGYLDGDLSEVELGELSAFLRADEPLRLEFARRTHFHRQIRDAFVVKSVLQGVIEPGDRVTESGDLVAPAAPLSPPSKLSGPTPRFGLPASLVRLLETYWLRLRGYSHSPRLAAVLVGGTLAGYFLIMVTLVLVARWNIASKVADQAAQHSQNTDFGIGQLLAEKEARWSSRSRVVDGVVKLGSRYELAAGQVEMTLSRGTTVRIEGPAAWEFDTEQRMNLEEGRLLARVPQTAVGFTVDTPAGSVVDLGTEFGVEVGADKVTDVQVLEGKVEMRTLHSGNQPSQARPLVAGQAMRVAGGGKSIASVEYQPDRFSREGSRNQPQPSSKRAVTFLNQLVDDFSGTAIDPTLWQLSGRGLESNSINPLELGFERPLVRDNRVVLRGKPHYDTSGQVERVRNSQFWYGSSLESVGTFASAVETTISVDRVEMLAAGSGSRSSLWIYGGDQHFLHFSHNTELRHWQYNFSDGRDGESAVASGITLADANDSGLHEMKLIFRPHGAGRATIEILLDDQSLAKQEFVHWTPANYRVILSGQVRTSGDSVAATFARFRAVSAEPPSDTITPPRGRP